MRLNELLQIIRESNKEDWNVIESNTLLSHVTTDSDNRVYADYHTNRASYIPDVSIGLAWGLNCNLDFREEWANCHPDPHASSHFLDVFYNGMLVYRVVYVVIDGGRSYMPLPRREINENHETLGWYITSEEYEFFKLFNSIQPFDTQYESYLRRSGIEVR